VQGVAVLGFVEVLEFVAEEFVAAERLLDGLPPLELAEPRAVQEVARPAGEVQHPHDAVAEGVEGRRECAVEDELLDEHGRLQEGVAFARELGEVLVEVAEEAGGVGDF